MMRVCVVGLGHVGLPTAAVLAARGHRVLGCDTNPLALAAIEAGRPLVREAGLDALLATALASGRLALRATPGPAEAFLIAVPTPLGPGRRADLGAVHAATDAIAPCLKPGDLVVLESTCPVGTTEALAERLRAARPDLALPRSGQPAPPGCVHLAHCPERVLPGDLLRELVANDRIIGGLTPDCAALAAALYAGFVAGACHLTDARTAELAKLAENAFRDVNIAFANELAGLCEGFGIEPRAAIALANRHPRVAILNPGPGVGGHCIPVDPWFLAEAAPAATPLIQAARGVNEARPGQVVARLRGMAAALRGGAEGRERPAIACLGLAYKPDVADLRGSPALAVAEALSRDGTLRLLCCDPMLDRLPPPLAGQDGVAWLELGAALAQADIVAILVPHAAFRALPAAAFADRPVLDAAGMLR
ncbi:nucleotide sugar dehydrogenase [Falsiroseomonas selenitidurans]|uniref:Nucleotide sugar dehydrogenase n=1 Tax=Falsiroseomonas selenitidurans TaxID=2716335 RepID=A0ABX1E684_9PROT|nr:nucleotide sugar dehydrogenase [Falsiroseomonas selenitidurans]NKC32250.1 nucleotide sugar dehydrogenase [Falsiroseomonas selenitidurans]